MPLKLMMKRRKRKHRQHREVLLCASLLAVACLVGLLLLPERRQEPVQLVTNPTLNFHLEGAFGPEFAGEIIAEKKGYFERSGVSVRLVASEEQRGLTAQVASTPSIGVTTGMRFLLAAWRGEAIVAFGASFLDTPTAIFSTDGSKIKTPKDLLGKRVGFRPNSDDALVYQAMMERLGLSSSKVENISMPDGFSFLTDGKVDAVVGNIANVSSLSANDNALNLIKPSDYGIHVPGLVYFASASLVRDRPSIIRNVLSAVILGWRDTYDDLDGSVSIIAGFGSARSPSAVRSALLRQRDLVRPTGTRIAEFDQSRWENLRDILVHSKAGVDTVALSSVVSYDFLRDVYRRPSISTTDPQPSKGANEPGASN